MEYKEAREAWDRRGRELESEISRLQRQLNHSFKQMQDMERRREVMYQSPVPLENPHKAERINEINKILKMSVRRSRTWLNYWPRKRVHYWKQTRKAESESGSWRRTSKHWLRGRWTERQRWKGKTLYLLSLCMSVLNCWYLCRMKERAKRAGVQRKEEESERSALQVIRAPYLPIPTDPALCCSFSSLFHLVLFPSLSWSRRRLSFEACRRSFRAWGIHWPRETRAFCSSRAPSPPWHRSSPLPTGKRSETPPHLTPEFAALYHRPATCINVCFLRQNMRPRWRKCAAFGSVWTPASTLLRAWRAIWAPWWLSGITRSPSCTRRACRLHSWPSSWRMPAWPWGKEERAGRRRGRACKSRLRCCIAVSA